MRASADLLYKKSAVALLAAIAVSLCSHAAAESRDPCASLSKQAERLADQVEILSTKRGAIESRLSSKPRGNPGTFNPNGDDSLRMIIGRQADAESEKDRIDRKLAECEARQDGGDDAPPPASTPSVKENRPHENGFSTGPSSGGKEGDEWGSF